VNGSRADLVSISGISPINGFVARFAYRFVFSSDRTHDALIVKHGLNLAVEAGARRMTYIPPD
jgi:hypothetical protein